MKPKLNADGSIDMPTWVKRGQVVTNRRALDRDDPDRPENIIHFQFGLDPRDYGINERPDRNNGDVDVPPGDIRWVHPESKDSDSQHKDRSSGYDD